MFKSLVKYLFVVGATLAFSQVPIGRSTVGAEFTSTVGQWSQQAWKLFKDKKKNLLGATTALKAQEPEISERELKSILPNEESSESDREQVKELLGQD